MQYSQRTGDLVSVVRWSDFYTTAQLRNAPYSPSLVRFDGSKVRAVRRRFPHCRSVPQTHILSETGPDKKTERDRLIGRTAPARAPAPSSTWTVNDAGMPFPATSREWEGTSSRTSRL